MVYSSLVAFMRDKVGPNWVVSRRTPRVVHLFGDDVICLSPAKFAKLQAEFDAQAPSVENAVRAMLGALKPLAKYLANNGGDEAYHDADGTGWLTRTRAAIAQAEAAGITVTP